MNINKYLLKDIVSYVDPKTKLNLIRYNKKLMSKLDIELYTYQKAYFNLVITETLLDNKSVLNKIFDEETLNKLISDFEKDKTGIYENEVVFEKVTEFEIYNYAIRTAEFSNLSELILDNKENLEIPCELLKNLEKLYLFDITNIKILTNNSNISLNKLKYLYLDNVSFEENQDVKIIMKNLVYLDLRLLWLYDIDKEKYYLEDELNNLMGIFGFDFLSLFFVKGFTDDYKLVKDKFKNPKELFNQKIINKLDYFYFEISFETPEGQRYEKEKFLYKYLFSKSRNNKYIFDTTFQTESFNEGNEYQLIQQEYRICDNRNYNAYNFIDKDMIIETGKSEDVFFEEKFTDKDFDVNTFKILENDLYDNRYERYENFFLSLLNKFKYNNKLEVIEFDYLDINQVPNFFHNLRKFKKLRIFKINEDCLLTDKQLITLLKCLSEFKYLLLFDISFGPIDTPSFSGITKKMIYKLFPDVSFKKTEEKKTLVWNNKNPVIQIK